MAPCFSTPTTSIRQASMTMSWVAEKKPTMTARAAMVTRLDFGFWPAISQSPRMITAWATSIQDRRWPSQRVRRGRLVRSMTGAQRNLRAVNRVARLKKPMTVSLMSASRSQRVRVSKISRAGRPAAKPRKNMEETLRMSRVPSPWAVAGGP